jgi:ankyrin repeat protein
MKSNNFIDTTSDDYYLNPYKYINQNNNTADTINYNNNITLYDNNFDSNSNMDSNTNLNLIIKALTSIIMSNNEIPLNDISSKQNIKLKSNIKSNNVDKFICFKLVANNETNELNLFLSKNKENRENIDIQDDDGDTALHIAIFLSNYIACNILISNGANIFIKDKWGQIPLHRICFTLKDKNTIKIINLMFKHQQKSDIFNSLDKYNNTPLHLVLKYILKNNIIVDKNILSIINRLIELTNINLINNDGLSIKDLIDMLNLTK